MLLIGSPDYFITPLLPPCCSLKGNLISSLCKNLKPAATVPKKNLSTVLVGATRKRKYAMLSVKSVKVKKIKHTMRLIELRIELIQDLEKNEYEKNIGKN